VTEVAPEAVPEETLPTYAYAYVGLPGQAPRTVLDYSPLTIDLQLQEGEVWIGSDVLGEFAISADGADLVPLAPAIDALRQARINELHRETATRFNLAPTDAADQRSHQRRPAAGARSKRRLAGGRRRGMSQIHHIEPRAGELVALATALAASVASHLPQIIQLLVLLSVLITLYEKPTVQRLLARLRGRKPKEADNATGR
jgi:hypothetical protein